MLQQQTTKTNAKQKTESVLSCNRKSLCKKKNPNVMSIITKSKKIYSGIQKSETTLKIWYLGFSNLI